MTRMSTIYSRLSYGSGTTLAGCGVSAKAYAETAKTAKEVSWMLADRIAGLSLSDWAIIVGVLEKTYALQSDPSRWMPILAMAVDSGGEDGVTDNAYKFWRQCRSDGLGKRVYLIKGDSTRRQKIITKTHPDNTGRSDRRADARGEVPVYLLQTDLLKDQLSNNLERETPGNGLIPRVADALKDIHINHIDQVAESDANLLARLARDYNAVSKPSGGYWLFLQQGATATASGKQTGGITITPDEVSNWSYSEGERGSSTGKATGSGGKAKEKIGVRYYDEEDGTTKTSSVEHDGPAMTNPYTQSEKNTAEQQANSRKTQAKRNEQKMTLTGPCRPKHVPLTAEASVSTSGFGSREDRAWVVESLGFSLTSAGFSYTYNLVVDIRKPAAASKKSEKQDKKGPSYFG